MNSGPKIKLANSWCGICIQFTGSRVWTLLRGSSLMNWLLEAREESPALVSFWWLEPGDVRVNNVNLFAVAYSFYTTLLWTTKFNYFPPYPSRFSTLFHCSLSLLCLSHNCSTHSLYSTTNLKPFLFHDTSTAFSGSPPPLGGLNSLSHGPICFSLVTNTWSKFSNMGVFGFPPNTIALTGWCLQCLILPGKTAQLLFALHSWCSSVFPISDCFFLGRSGVVHKYLQYAHAKPQLNNITEFFFNNLKFINSHATIKSCGGGVGYYTGLTTKYLTELETYIIIHFTALTDVKCVIEKIKIQKKKHNICRTWQTERKQCSIVKSKQLFQLYKVRYALLSCTVIL